MNSARDISLEVYKNIFWVWLHLGSVIIINALGYISLLNFGVSKDISFLVAFIGVIISTLVPTLRYSSPMQARYRFYWAVKLYSIYFLVMLFLSVQNTFLLAIWVGFLVADFLLILSVVFFKQVKFIMDKFKNNEFQQNRANFNAPDYQKVNFVYTQSETFGSILSDEMYKRNWSVGHVSQLTGVEEDRILHFTKGEEKPTQEEAQTLFGYFGIDPSRIENLIDSTKQS